MTIRLITAPHFIATKIEAFAGHQVPEGLVEQHEARPASGGCLGVGGRQQLGDEAAEPTKAMSAMEMRPQQPRYGENVLRCGTGASTSVSTQSP